MAPGARRVLLLGRAGEQNWEELTNFFPPTGSVGFAGPSGSGDTLLIGSASAIPELGFSTVFSDTFERGAVQN